MPQPIVSTNSHGLQLAPISLLPKVPSKKKKPINKINLHDPSDDHFYNAANSFEATPNELFVFAHGADNGVAAIMSHTDGSEHSWNASELNDLLVERNISPSSYKAIHIMACWAGADIPVDYGDGTMITNTFARDFSNLNPGLKILAPNSPIFYQKHWVENFDANGIVTSRKVTFEPLLRYGDPFADDYYRTMTDRCGSWQTYFQNPNPKQ